MENIGLATLKQINCDHIQNTEGRRDPDAEVYNNNMDIPHVVDTRGNDDKSIQIDYGNDIETIEKKVDNDD